MSNSDWEIEKAIRGKWTARMLDLQQVEANVKNGFVTFVGKVDHKGISDFVEQSAEGVPGVTGVKNEITLREGS